MRRRREVLAAVLAALICLAAVALALGLGDDAPEPPAVAPATAGATPTPSPAAWLVEPGTVGAVTTARATPVRTAPEPSASVRATLRTGITLPVTERREGFFRILTPCELPGWVAAADVTAHPKATGTPDSLDQATIVVDPGHGGSLDGAVGPTGLAEREPNADIAARLGRRLHRARVFYSGALDVTAGLGYRTTLADALGAHAFVSIHNNAEPDGPSDRPGTETYYQSRSPASRRLAGLLYEEVASTLAAFEASWVSDRDAGAKPRLNASGGDYYGLLRRASVPTVLVEALFISNPSEEALLRRGDVREAIAAAMTRALERYIATDDPGSGYVEPYPREPGPSGRLPSRCVDPAP